MNKPRDANDILREDGTDKLRETFDRAHEHAQREKKTHSADLRSYLEMIQQPKGTWLIDQLLPAGSNIVLFGGSNTFKSFLLYDMLCSIGTDTPWHGHKVASGTVVIIASEGRVAVGNKRIPAWMAHHGIPLERRRGIFLHKATPLLNDPQELDKLMNAITSVVPVAAIAYDVQRDTMLGAEKDEPVSTWIAARERIQKKFGCSQISITHSPFSDAGRARGPTELWGSYDTRLKTEGDKEARTVVLSVDRHKDFDSLDLAWGFRLESVKIDHGACKGEFSLVPVLDQAVAKKEKSSKLTDSALEVLKAFKFALAEGAGKHVNDEHVPASSLVLTTPLLRLYFDKKSPDKSPDTRKKTFKRGTARLIETGFVATWENWWWLTATGESTKC
jgi:AAA domain